MAATQRSLLLLLLFVGTMLLAISLASGADSYGGCGNSCSCPNKQSCTSGGKCCWSYGKCKKVDFNYDEHNCGRCDYKCGQYQLCCYGKCTNVKSDNYNCGSCGNNCKKYGKVCKYGSCVKY